MNAADPSENEPIPQPPPLPRTASVAKWRWWMHLLIIGSYPLLIAYFSSKVPADSVEPALSADALEFFVGFLFTVGSFAFLFALAWLCSRATVEDLWLRWKPGWMPWLLGFVYSMGLRVVIGIAAYAIIIIVVLASMAHSGTPLSKESFETMAKELVQANKPDTKHLVDTDALVTNPFYLLINVTLVSFVMAGFREELWRGGMFAGFKALYPDLFARRWGQFLFIFIVAVIFGIGHWPQGIAGVILTGGLGFLLGLIMVFHKSIWQATWAHGFFDATSFVLMYILFKYGDRIEGLKDML